MLRVIKYFVKSLEGHSSPFEMTPLSRTCNALSFTVSDIFNVALIVTGHVMAPYKLLYY